MKYSLPAIVMWPMNSRDFIRTHQMNAIEFVYRAIYRAPPLGFIAIVYKRAEILQTANVAISQFKSSQNDMPHCDGLLCSMDWTDAAAVPKLKCTAQWAPARATNGRVFVH